MQVVDENKNTYKIEEILGTGGQGAVFKVKKNSRIAIKCLTNDMGNIVQEPNIYEEYRKKIIGVIARADIPCLANPICMLQKPYCGYVMRFMEGMESIEKNLMLPKNDGICNYYEKTGGLKKRYYVLRNLAKLLTKLYQKGLVYSDISPRNVFVSKDKDNYEVWLIDVDNLHYQGEESSIVGTPMYRAPEIFLGNENTIESDCYSFVLLAFELLTMSKPFDGDYNEDSEEDDWDDDSSNDINNSFYNKMESGELPFVCSKIDRSNKQNSGIPLGKVTTKRIANLFTKTFEEGKTNPSKRPSIYEWLKELTYVCDSILKNECKHDNLSKECFLCNDEDKNSTLKVTSYQINRYVDDNKIFEDKKEICSIRIKDKKIVLLPNYLFYNIDYLNIEYPVKIVQEEGKYRVDNNDLYNFSVKFENEICTKKHDMNGKIIDVIQHGNIVRKIEFEKE